MYGHATRFGPIPICCCGEYGNCKLVQPAYNERKRTDHGVRREKLNDDCTLPVCAYDNRYKHDYILDIILLYNFQYFLNIFSPISGDVTVRISAVSMMGIDSFEKTVHVKFDGVTNYYHTPYLMDIVNSGSKIAPAFQVNVTERFFYPGKS